MPVYPIEAPVRTGGQTVPILLARASAGFPSPAGDDLEDEIDPIAWVVRHPCLASGLVPDVATVRWPM
jgi:DNA polymerase V